MLRPTFIQIRVEGQSHDGSGTEHKGDTYSKGKWALLLHGGQPL